MAQEPGSVGAGVAFTSRCGDAEQQAACVRRAGDTRRGWAGEMLPCRARVMTRPFHSIRACCAVGHVSLTGRPCCWSRKLVSLTGRPCCWSGKLGSLTGRPCCWSGKLGSLTGRPCCWSGKLVEVADGEAVLLEWQTRVGGRCSINLRSVGRRVPLSINLLGDRK